VRVAHIRPVSSGSFDADLKYLHPVFPLKVRLPFELLCIAGNRQLPISKILCLTGKPGINQRLLSPIVLYCKISTIPLMAKIGAFFNFKPKNFVFVLI
jgi:hypothetical protein